MNADPQPCNKKYRYRYLIWLGGNLPMRLALLAANTSEGMFNDAR